MKKVLCLILCVTTLLSCQVEDDHQTNVSGQETMSNVNDAKIIQIKLKDNQRMILESYNDEYLLDGDIVITKEQFSKIKSQEENKGAVTSDLSKRWAGGNVNFIIDPNFQSPQNVYNAISMWESEVPGLNFIEGSATNYIKFQDSNVNNSYVGRIGGPQVINIVSYTDGVVAHEIGHALGMYHEQSRSDRDNYITINWDNIISGKEHNFQTYIEQGNGGTDVDEFDYNSLLLYSSYAFSNGNGPTITRKDGSTIYSNRSYLSTGDIAAGNYMYPEPGMSASISGPAKADNSGTYTWSAHVQNGVPPYSYEWTRISPSGTEYSWGGGQQSVTVNMPYEQDLELNLEVTDGEGNVATAFHYTMNTGSGGKPGF